MYLERESKRLCVHEQGEGQREGERDSQAELDLRTLRS